MWGWEKGEDFSRIFSVEILGVSSPLERGYDMLKTSFVIAIYFYLVVFFIFIVVF